MQEGDTPVVATLDLVYLPEDDENQGILVVLVVAQLPDGIQDLLFIWGVSQLLHNGTLRDLVDGFELDCGALVQELSEVFLPPGTDTNIILQQGLSVFGAESV